LRLFRLDNRVALVTGAGGGIGRAIALAFAQAGAHVAVTEIEAQIGAARDTAAQIAALQRRSLGIALDVTRLSEINPLLERVEAELGAVEILVNNAGINVHKAALDISEEEWDRVLDVDLKGAFFMSQACARRMIARARGVIVNIV